jgi:hypothetical protein
LKASGYAKGRIVWAVSVPLQRNLSNIGSKPLGPAYRPVERENHNFSYIFRILALEGLTPSKGL